MVAQATANPVLETLAKCNTMAGSYICSAIANALLVWEVTGGRLEKVPGEKSYVSGWQWVWSVCPPKKLEFPHSMLFPLLPVPFYGAHVLGSSGVVLPSQGLDQPRSVILSSPIREEGGCYVEVKHVLIDGRACCCDRRAQMMAERGIRDCAYSSGCVGSCWGICVALANRRDRVCPWSRRWRQLANWVL